MALQFLLDILSGRLALVDVPDGEIGGTFKFIDGDFAKFADQDFINFID